MALASVSRGASLTEAAHAAGFADAAHLTRTVHRMMGEAPSALGCGLPVHSAGISPVPGPAYVGLPFQRNRGSALLDWVGEDAALVAAAHTAPLRTPS